MRNILIVFFATMIAGVIHAQDSVRMRIHYATKFLRYEGEQQMQDDETILDIGDHSSHFYSLYSVKRDEIKDSVLRMGGSLGEVMNALEKSPYPSAKEKYQIWKNYPKEGILTFTDAIIKKFRYTEEMAVPEWELTSKDSIIAEYNCQQAETTFLGRKWTAWFATDIPVADGPWKLQGLPGLILAAEDADHYFKFECIEIENVSNEAMRQPVGKYVECTKKEYHDLIIEKNKDPYALQGRLTGFKCSVGISQSGKPLVYEERVAILHEK